MQDIKMKDIRYSNRGQIFESFIEFSNARYRAAGLAVVEKQHTHFIPIRNRQGKIVSCKVEEKATVDYLGRYRNIPVAIEAKHTKDKRIRFNEVKEHQAQFLSDFTDNDGAFGAVVVSFDLERFFLVPWEFWRDARDWWNNKNSTCTGYTYNLHGANFFKWKRKASISADELPEEWEIKPNNKYGLAYLSKIDTYMNVKV